MEQRYAIGPDEVKKFSTDEIRKNFLMESLFVEGQIVFVYTHYDRMMIGGANPGSESVRLETYPELRSEYFLERREIGIINVGGDGRVGADGTSFDVAKMDCLYLGKGTKEVSFSSVDMANPALFYLLSCPAHEKIPARMMKKAEASPVDLGAAATANQRTIYKYIHLQGIPSCQLVMGLTVLREGSVWNTIPSHVHDRRMEAYFYFDVPKDQKILHLMGQPSETRHIFVANHQAIVSPSWSIHSGCGTSNYAFIWGMAGENKDYADMDPAPLSELK